MNTLVMKYFKRVIVVVSCILIASCTDDEGERFGIQSCGIGDTESIGPVTEVSYGKAENSAACKFEGFRTEVQAIASLRAAGVCPLHIELRNNPNKGFPCESFGPNYYFHAQVPESQVASAVKAGWYYRFSQDAISLRLKQRKILLNKLSDMVVVESPDCGCIGSQALATCRKDGQQDEDCLDYWANKIFIEEIRFEIDRVNEYLLEAGEVTGVIY